MAGPDPRQSPEARVEAGEQLREFLRVRGMTCHACGYNLRGLKGVMCPECGVVIARPSVELLRGECARCGYVAGDMLAARCPECGSTLDEDYGWAGGWGWRLIAALLSGWALVGAMGAWLAVMMLVVQPTAGAVLAAAAGAFPGAVLAYWVRGGRRIRHPSPMRIGWSLVVAGGAAVVVCFIAL